MPNNHDWQSLVELSGLLVSEPVLRERFPDGPQPLDAWLSRRFRAEYERWQGAEARRDKDADAADRALRRWIDFVLTGLLDYDAGRLRSGQALPPDVFVELTDYMQTLRPNMALVDESGIPLLLVYIADGDLDRPEQVTGRWKASPFTKLDRLLRETRVQLGILTNGQDWRLVYAAPGLPTSYITWTASGWSDERSTVQAFDILLRDPARLLEMAAESQQRQADVTDQLGNQVLSALAIFVFELDFADRAAGGDLLAAMTPESVYETALFLMMRLVFIFYAEGKRLLPHGDVFYDQAYGLTYLWNHLERERQMDEELLARRIDAWPGLLATFRLIHLGCSHPDFAMVAYGGALFDPARFPLLEDPRLRITNEALWQMLRQLTTAEGKDGRQRVSYRALQVEQLGYVYENLLGYTVRAAKEPMIQPAGGVEAFPLTNFQNALAEGKLYDYFKSVTRLHWSEAKKFAGQVEERAQQSDDTGWIFEPVADAYLQPGNRYVAFQMGTRKRGGIFYTPPQLTSFLVEQALRPQCYDDPDADTRRVRDPMRILSLTVCDPAMGSGAFLVQAVRYLADRLLEAWDAAVAEAGGQTLVMPYAQPERAALENYGPIPTDRAEALAWARRLVAERCIYGVDLNPLAVELAKLSLWLVTLSKDKPFTFLDHRLRHGNSLIGASFFAEATLEIKQRRAKEYAAAGVERTVRQIAFIPDAALEGVKGAVTKDAYRKLVDANRQAQQAIAAGQMGLFADMSVENALAALVARKRELMQPTRRAGDYDSKEALLRQVVEQGDYPRLKEIADLWCAVWFWPRDIEQDGLPPSTQEYHDAVYTILEQPAIITTGQARLDRIRDTARTVAGGEAFFHWEVEYPEIFTRDNPGFDGVVGNPPWELVQINSQEFFEVYDPNFRAYGKQEAIQVSERLMTDEPEIARVWEQYAASMESQTNYFVSGIAYHHHGTGKAYTYKLFIENGYKLLRDNGYFGLVVPSGVYTDEGSTEIRRMMFDRMRIDGLYAYENRGKIFPIDSRFKFVLLSAQNGGSTDYFRAAFMRHRIEDLADIRETSLTMSPELVRRFSPDTLSVMEFKSQQQIDIATKIYNNHPLIGEENSDGWNAVFAREFNVTDDSDLFSANQNGLPLYEGKMIWQFDAFFASPQYWVEEEAGQRRLQGKNPDNNDFLFPRLVFRSVASNTNERTLICSLIPGRVFTVNSVFGQVGNSLSSDVQLYLEATMNSFVLDFVLRQKMSANVNLFYVLQLPIPRLTAGNRYFDELVERAANLTYTSYHFADLWQEVTGELWPDDPYICPPPRSGDRAIEDIRQRLRDEIDALVAHLYGLSREDFAHILGTFPLVFPDTEAGQAKQAVYDEFAEITRGWARQ